MNNSAAIQAVISELADDGWSWVMVDDGSMANTDGFGSEKPLPGGFTRMQKSRLGCFVSEVEGEIYVDHGRSMPQDDAPPQDDAEPTTPEDCLAASLSAAVSDMMADSPRTAVAALVAALASGGHILNVRAGDGSRGTAETFAQVFDHVRHATDAGLISLLGSAVRSMVAVTPEEADAPALRAVLDRFGLEATEKAIAYAFDRRAYFEAATDDMMAAAIFEATRLDHRAEAVRAMSRSEAVAYAVRETAATGWLPAGLRDISR